MVWSAFFPQLDMNTFFHQRDFFSFKHFTTFCLTLYKTSMLDPCKSSGDRLYLFPSHTENHIEIQRIAEVLESEGPWYEASCCSYVQREQE